MFFMSRSIERPARLPALLLLVVALSRAGFSWAAPAASESHPPAATGDARIAQLIRQLGDPEYVVRQEATRQLEQIGPASKEPLVEALTHPDAEVRLRAQQILINVLEADFEARLEAFSNDPNSSNSYDLPCWNQFRKIAGDSPAARLLFADAVRHESVLLETVAQDPQQATDAILQRCDTLIASHSRSRAGRFGVRPNRPIPTGRMVALLLASCCHELAGNEAVGMKVSQLFHQSRMINEIPANDDDHPLRRLLGAWVERTAETGLAFQSVWLAMRFQLKEGLAPATSLLKRGEHQPYVRQMAILAIGKLGGKEHVDVLEPLLKDASSCNPNPDEAATPYRCEIRDVALCAIMHLFGRNPKDFGFEKIQNHPQTLFNQNSMGFDSEQQRAAAVAKWQAWREKQPVTAENGAAKR
jgi:hypothetical protein